MLDEAEGKQMKRIANAFGWLTMPITWVWRGCFDIDAAMVSWAHSWAVLTTGETKVFAHREYWFWSIGVQNEHANWTLFLGIFSFTWLKGECKNHRRWSFDWNID